MPDSNITPTDIDFLDRYLDGGTVPGEVNAILGPTGVGKTTLAMQIAVNAAKRIAHNHERKVVVYASYEQTVSDLAGYALSYAATVPNDRVHEAELSTAEDLRSYELELFRDEIERGGTPLGESERIADAERRLSPGLHIHDFSGVEYPSQIDSRNAAAVHLSEQIEMIVENLGKSVEFVIIDTAYDAMLKLRSQHELYHRGIAGLTDWFASDCRGMIANLFDCPVWIVSQLDLGLVGRGPTAIVHHSQVGRNGQLGDNVDHAFVLGNVETGLLTIRCTVSRRGVRDVDPRVLMINGGYRNLIDVNSDYLIDRQNRRIVSRERHRAGVVDVEF